MIAMQPFGPNTTLHHIGLVVPSIQEVCPDCQISADPIQKVNVAFIYQHGQKLELIEPQGEKSPVSQSLQKGTKLVHLCYEVENIEEAISLSAQHGFRCIAKPVPAVAFDQRCIAWVFHRTFGLIELLEKNSNNAAHPV